MNDRYHAFGRQGFGAIYGSKNLKAIVVGGSARCRSPQPDGVEGGHQAHQRRVQELDRLVHAVLRVDGQAQELAGVALPRVPAAGHEDPGAGRGDAAQLWADRGTTGAVSLSVENGDAPVKNWKGVGSRDFPLSKQGLQARRQGGRQVRHQEAVVRRLPDAVQGHRQGEGQARLEDVRRPDYETICGFGANLLNDDLELVTACHDACNRYGMDAVSSSATTDRWVCEAVERGLLTAGRPRRHRPALGQRRRVRSR